VPTIALSLGTLLAIIIVVSLVVTASLAAASYAAYRLRVRRRPKPAGPESENPYFERYLPPPPS
jgi:Tfp pilus assembly protein PilE